MKEIHLTKERLALVDPEDFDFLSQWKWYCHYGYAQRVSYKPTKKIIHMHRLILEHHYLDLTGKEVDHIDHNSLNNQKNNLRIVSHQQNMFNGKKHKDNTSGYRGVSWHNESNKWSAQITTNYKQLYLGEYKNKQSAVKARQQAEKKYFGQFRYIS